MHRFQGCRLAMPTLHGKEEIIRQQFAAWQWDVVAVPVDTNGLGTFSGDVERPADPLATAWMKLEAGLPYADAFDGLIASEGSFYPHPEVPLVTLNTEILVLRDLRTQWQYEAAYTNYFPAAVRRQVMSWQDLSDLATQLDFPRQGLILTGACGPQQQRMYLKDLHHLDALQKGFEDLTAGGEAIWVETDFRAMRSPLRREHIAAAAQNLYESLNSCCPQCLEPGYTKHRANPGLPCSWCSTPTRLTRSWTYRCGVCHHTADIPVSATAADPGHCDRCNP